MVVLMIILCMLCSLAAYRMGKKEGAEIQRRIEMGYPTRSVTHKECEQAAREISSMLSVRMFTCRPKYVAYPGEDSMEAQQWLASQHRLWARGGGAAPSQTLLDFVRYARIHGCEVELKQINKQWH